MYFNLTLMLCDNIVAQLLYSYANCLKYSEITLR